MLTNFGWGNLKATDHLGNLGVNFMIILKRIVKE
jgi:hypothetical protein